MDDKRLEKISKYMYEIEKRLSAIGKRQEDITWAEIQLEKLGRETLLHQSNLINYKNLILKDRKFLDVAIQELKES